MTSSVVQPFFGAALFLPLTFPSLTNSQPCVSEVTVCTGSGPDKRPLPGCTAFAQCVVEVEKVEAFYNCQANTIFDESIMACNWVDQSICNVVSCPPTGAPTKTPTSSPSDMPSQSPTTTPTEVPSLSPSANYDNLSRSFLRSRRDLIQKYILVSKAGEVTYSSMRYTFDALLSSLDLLGVQPVGEDMKYQFWLFEGDPEKYVYGLVNLAAFLANAMVESIQTDSCDERNWQTVAGRYAISNSCGQGGRSYQHMGCEEMYTCPVDDTMKIVAVTGSNEVRAPPPFSCEPGSGEGHYAGYWDNSSGTVVTSAYSNTLGRTDTEGCCWWGRGALSTRGTCNIGKFNWFMGKKAALDGRPSFYPGIDFCKNPEATCTSNISNELVWTIALFEWSERIQTYNNNDWEYGYQLIKFVEEGMTDDSFIDSVGRILSNGCHEEGCSGFEVSMAEERNINFKLILNDVLDIASLLDETPSKLGPQSSSVESSTTFTPSQSPSIYPSLVQLKSPPSSRPSVRIKQAKPNSEAIITLEGNNGIFLHPWKWLILGVSTLMSIFSALIIAF